MSLPISVIVCTHNPRREYLSETLDNLGAQSLPADQWELLIVDNGSEPAISEWVNISWHPRGRIIREESLGLTNARLCGIANTSGATIVFVDDDNLLATEYLKQVLLVAGDWPLLGAWGGDILPRYELPPDPRLEKYYAYLAVRPITENRWGNIYSMDITPYGAGMAVRRSVAMRYRDLAVSTVQRRRLDRAGDSLISCGDVDLAWTSVDMGLGMGVFKGLKVTHLIPARRMQLDYLLKMVEANRASHILLDAMRERSLPLQRGGILRWLLDELRFMQLSQIDREFSRAARKGTRLGLEMAMRLDNSQSHSLQR